MISDKRKITLPAQWTLQNSILFGKQLQSSINYKKIILDFSFVKFVQPFSLTYIAVCIKSFREKFPDIIVELNLSESDAIGYLGFIGFFSYCGYANIGQKIGYAPGSQKYIPLSLLSRKKLGEDAHSKTLNDYLDRDFSVTLANMLTQGESKFLTNSLSFLMRELIRNVIEHSDTENFTYCAQHWDNSEGIVEIALMDQGVGLKNSLRRNPNFRELSSDNDAINYCLLPGVSGRNWRGKKSIGGEWENSGFGLFMMSKICGNGGSFFLASGDSGLLLENGDKEKFSLKFQGTILRLSLNTRNIRATDFRQKLSEYNKEGEEIAKQYLTLEQLTSSRASRLISGM